MCPHRLYQGPEVPIEGPPKYERMDSEGLAESIYGIWKSLGIRVNIDEVAEIGLSCPVVPWASCPDSHICPGQHDSTVGE